jgi:hypothetical protein
MHPRCKLHREARIVPRPRKPAGQLRAHSALYLLEKIDQKSDPQLMSATVN